jgi:transcriptional regulator with XRE-family HTH domain
MNLGNRLHTLRKEKDMTLGELSHKSGVALATLSRISTEKKRSQAGQARTEFGKFRMTTQERQALVSVCKTLNVTESQFLRDSVREAVMLLHV